MSPRVLDIQRAVCAHFDIALLEMSSQRRSRCLARPRQIAMYLSRQLTPHSLPAIGRMFGGRDHSTVIHAVHQVERLRASDSEIDSAVRNIHKSVERRGEQRIAEALAYLVS